MLGHSSAEVVSMDELSSSADRFSSSMLFRLVKFIGVPNGVASFEGDVVAVDSVELQLHAIETVLNASSRPVRFGGGRNWPRLSQVHRDPIDIDGYFLFGGQPLSWGAVLAYVLSPDKEAPLGICSRADHVRCWMGLVDTPRFRHVS